LSLLLVGVSGFVAARHRDTPYQNLTTEAMNADEELTVSRSFRQLSQSAATRFGIASDIGCQVWRLASSLSVGSPLTASASHSIGQPPVAGTNYGGLQKQVVADNLIVGHFSVLRAPWRATCVCLQGGTKSGNRPGPASDMPHVV
jgi:hypothetical protein